MLRTKRRRLRTSNLFLGDASTSQQKGSRVSANQTRRQGRTQMTSPDKPERTSGGIVGKLAGRAKEAAGAVLNDEELSREGRLQQTQVDVETEAKERAAEAQQREAEAELEQEKAETEAERARLENELREKEREEAAEADRRKAESLAEQRSAEEIAAAEQEKASEESQARTIEIEAERARAEEKRAALRLDQEARQAEATADAIDPKENA
jgi:uncharacterized protein YjbJ (UPF0337 family)